MTYHNEAKKNEIASIVLMPGDPLRAKMIADTYLTDVKQVNKIRNMYAYTGYYKGKRLTVMAHGMGVPSIGIYAYELYKFYDVECIIRIGSCGGYHPDLKLLDVIIAEKSYTESNFAYTFNNDTTKEAYPNIDITNLLENIAKKKEIRYKRGNILTSDCFDLYVSNFDNVVNRLPDGANIIAVEMEAFGLFYLASMLNKKCACLLSVVDSKYIGEEVSAEDREDALKNMIELSLDAAVEL